VLLHRGREFQALFSCDGDGTIALFCQLAGHSQAQPSAAPGNNYITHGG
jgi:hypothetical protein